MSRSKYRGKEAKVLRKKLKNSCGVLEQMSILRKGALWSEWDVRFVVSDSRHLGIMTSLGVTVQMTGCFVSEYRNDFIVLWDLNVDI